MSNYGDSISRICLTPQRAATHLLFLRKLTRLPPHSPKQAALLLQARQSHEKPEIEFNSLLFHSRELNCRKYSHLSSNCSPYVFVDAIATVTQKDELLDFAPQYKTE